MTDLALLPPEPYGALIFDCDGTLVDSLPLHYRAWVAALAPIGAILPAAWYYSRVGVSRYEFLRQVGQEFSVEFDASVVSADQARSYLDNLATIRVIEQVAAVARNAHWQVPMAVASGSPHHLVAATLQAAGLGRLFDVVVTLEDVAQSKPAPDLFLEAARRLRVEPAACVVYEDTDEGLEAARRAGMRAIDVRSSGRAVG